MNLVAAVPIKPLAEGKSRLTDVLTDQQRSLLNEQLFVHTLEVLKSFRRIETVLVVSSDRRALDQAPRYGVQAIAERAPVGLNGSLFQAQEVSIAAGAAGFLVLPVDLPGLAIEDLEEMCLHLDEGPIVVIAPDRHRRGTNALLLSPPGVIEFQFGPESFELHCSSAQQAGARLVVVETWGLALDLDTTEDLSVAAMTLHDRESIMILETLRGYP
ncbi:MAG TPA: 2-phospho-L-lactate guanylyltransferase [Anaerolineales bacterium]|nr:2-phospho-L-lactate guanylyltransferase [Anaerolineales bacterium]